MKRNDNKHPRSAERRFFLGLTAMFVIAATTAFLFDALSTVSDSAGDFIGYQDLPGGTDGASGSDGSVTGGSVSNAKIFNVDEGFLNSRDKSVAFPGCNKAFTVIGRDADDHLTCNAQTLEHAKTDHCPLAGPDSITTGAAACAKYGAKKCSKFLPIGDANEIPFCHQIGTFPVIANIWVYAGCSVEQNGKCVK